MLMDVYLEMTITVYPPVEEDYPNTTLILQREVWMFQTLPNFSFGLQ